MLGGITHSQGKSFAKLLYLAPQYRLGDIDLTLLLEDLAKAAGSWGALHVIAEIDETNLVFNALRKSGFSVYAWQRMWDVSHLKPFVHNTGTWRRIRSVQQPAIQSLYYQIVPPLLHPVEPLTNPSKGVIYEGELNCFAGITSGAYGMVLTPLIHPEVNAVEEKLSSLLSSLPQRRGRSVYMCVRSYQTWLEPVLADLGAVATQRQAVMVKHLARFVKDEQSLATVPKGVSVQPSQMGRVETKD